MLKRVLNLEIYWQILIAILLAIAYGLLFPKNIQYVSWMGEIFLRALRMIVVPLVLTSLITGVSNVGGGSNLGRIGIKTMGYYLITSTLAILTGLILVNIIEPGTDTHLTLSTDPGQLNIEKKSFLDTLLDIVPRNIFRSFSEGDMLGIIFFAILFGFFVTLIEPKKRELLTDFFSGAFDVMMKITLFIIRFAPLGVFGLLSKVVAEQENLGELFSSLGLFMLVVLCGLIFHFGVTLPSILFFVAKVNPLKHLKAMITPLLTAFSTASSNATLPLTMEAVEDNDGVSNKISSFVLPLGATINMDGTALYELVVAGFIAQIYGIDLSFTEQFIMVATALLASIGTAAVPMASLVTMTIIFSAIGLPLEGIALILPVDRILDMFRTTTNVWSDTCGTVFIAKSEGEELKV